MAAKNEPLYNDEGLSKDILLNLSGATHEDILSKIDEIYESWDEVEEEADPEKFCEDCEHIVIIKEREQYFGPRATGSFHFAGPSSTQKTPLAQGLGNTKKRSKIGTGSEKRSTRCIRLKRPS